MSLLRISAAIVFLGLSLSGCWNNDYAIVLPNGYLLERGNDQEIYIADNKGMVVLYGKILSYAIVSELVVGENSVPEAMADFQKKEAAPPGYFIFDTKQGRAITGLSHQDWGLELQKIGVKTPKLVEPDCHRNTFGFCSRS